jgi:hypothetical protein
MPFDSVREARAELRNWLNRLLNQPAATLTPSRHRRVFRGETHEGRLLTLVRRPTSTDARRASGIRVRTPWEPSIDGVEGQRASGARLPFVVAEVRVA